MGEAAPLPTLGWESLALSFASLGVVCVLAYFALRFLAGRGVGRATGAVRVLARCPLEPRRTVYLIEAAGRCFLVGAGEGAMALIAEVDRDKVAEFSAVPAPPGRFAEVLARMLTRSPGAGSEPPAMETKGPAGPRP